MLLEILVHIPSLILAEIAWCVRALMCLIILFVVAVGVVGLCWRCSEHRRHLSQPDDTHAPPPAPA